MYLVMILSEMVVWVLVWVKVRLHLVFQHTAVLLLLHPQLHVAPEVPDGGEVEPGRQLHYGMGGTGRVLMAPRVDVDLNGEGYSYMFNAGMSYTIYMSTLYVHCTIHT